MVTGVQGGLLDAVEVYIFALQFVYTVTSGFALPCTVTSHVWFCFSCRSRFWWESSFLQLKQLGMLLVVVVGRPLGTYIQTLIVMTLLLTEFGYELVLAPARHKHVQYMQAAAVGLLLYAALTVLLFSNYQNQAAQGGLVAAGVLVAVGHITLFVLYVYYIARGSRGKVNFFIVKGEKWVYGKLHKRFAPYAFMMLSSPLSRNMSLDTTISSFGSGRSSYAPGVTGQSHAI